MEHLYARKLPSARIEDVRTVYIAGARIRILVPGCRDALLRRLVMISVKKKKKKQREPLSLPRGNVRKMSEN